MSIEPRSLGGPEPLRKADRVELFGLQIVTVPMRHLLIILLIAVLPVRGWASERMSVSMAVQQMAVAASAPTEATDCPMLAQAPDTASTATAASIDVADVADAAGESISPLCKGCTTCQLCMAVVTGYPPMPDITLQLPQAKRLLASVSFSSAEPAPGFKPPIS